MSTKLDRMIGTARVAFRRYTWKDFTLQPGCAYGRDRNGVLFASFGVNSRKFGLDKPKRRHIIVFYCINEKKEMPVEWHKTFWGSNSLAIGRRPIIMEAGNYAAPWKYEWDWKQVPYEDPTAKEVFRVLGNYQKGIKKLGR